ncbi:glycosyltransferase family 2 protein [bacterium]|nr:glycosyltransferase family 2 protein [bacterium]
MNESVAIIVLTYNGLAYTRECLQSIAGLRGERPAVYVVDNASVDGTAEAIEREFGNSVTLLRNPSNLLYAGGNNVGIRRALDDGHTGILLLNNDTYLADDFLKQLTQAYQKKPRAILVPKIYYASQPDVLWYAGGIATIRRAQFYHRGIREKDTGQYDAFEPTDWATGCALFAPREIFEAIDLLDVALGLYNEDVDFCLRAKAANFEIYYVPSARVWHKVSAAVGGNLSWKKLSLKWRSLRILLRKHLPDPWERASALLDFMINEPVRAAARYLRKDS